MDELDTNSNNTWSYLQSSNQDPNEAYHVALAISQLAQFMGGELLLPDERLDQLVTYLKTKDIGLEQIKPYTANQIDNESIFTKLRNLFY